MTDLLSKKYSVVLAKGAIHSCVPNRFELDVRALRSG